MQLEATGSLESEPDTKFKLRGKLQATFDITPLGDVASLKAITAIPGEVVTCIKQQIQTTRFPKSADRNKTSITLHLVLQP